MGYQAVYRLCLVITLFFFVMSIFMINVKTSNDPRAGIQNGFWGIKYLIVIASMIAAFWIPDGSFGTVWMWFGLVGGFLFILIQLVLIIDFAHSWAEAWYANYQETDSKVLFHFPESVSKNQFIFFSNTRPFFKHFF